MHTLKVTNVVTMAHNDHRITAENDDLKIEITVKNTIDPDHNLTGIKTGDDLEEVFGSDNSALYQRNSSLNERIDQLENHLNDASKTISTLTTEREELKSKLTVATNEKENFSSQLNALKDENVELQNKLAELEKEISLSVSETKDTSTEKKS